MTRALDPRALAAARQRLREAAQPLGMVLSPAGTDSPALCRWHCPGCRCFAATCDARVLVLAEAPHPCAMRAEQDMGAAEMAACDAIRKSIGRAVA